MATIDATLAKAAAQIGNIGTPYNMWYWGYIQPAWCATGQSWCRDQLGMRDVKSAAVSTFLAQVGNEIAANSLSGVKPGDQACFNWDGRTSRGWMDHIEIVEWVNPATGQFGTIGFNVSNKVMRVTRTVYASYFVCFCRPSYDDSPTPTPTPSGSIVQRSTGNWRNAATSQSGLFATYSPGSVIEVVGWVYGEDPYGTGQSRWVKSKNNGKYAWEGLFNKADVDALSQIGGSTPAPQQSYWLTHINEGNWRYAATTNSRIYATYWTGATVECVGWVWGQDPYGDGRSRWVKSKNNGMYAWEGLFKRASVDAMPQL